MIGRVPTFVADCSHRPGRCSTATATVALDRSHDGDSGAIAACGAHDQRATHLVRCRWHAATERRHLCDPTMDTRCGTHQWCTARCMADASRRRQTTSRSSRGISSSKSGSSDARGEQNNVCSCDLHMCGSITAPSFSSLIASYDADATTSESSFSLLVSQLQQSIDRNTITLVSYTDEIASQMSLVQPQLVATYPRLGGMYSDHLVEMARFKRPPSVVRHVLSAALILCGHGDDAYHQLRRHLLQFKGHYHGPHSGWLAHKLITLDINTVTASPRQRVMNIINDEPASFDHDPWLFTPTLGAMIPWIRAVLRVSATLEYLRPIRRKAEQLEQSLRIETEQLEGMKQQRRQQAQHKAINSSAIASLSSSSPPDGDARYTFSEWLGYHGISTAFATSHTCDIMSMIGCYQSRHSGDIIVPSFSPAHERTIIMINVCVRAHCFVVDAYLPSVWICLCALICR